jgi:hypothetical protein
MLLAQDNDMIETFSPDQADETFAAAVLPR